MVKTTLVQSCLSWIFLREIVFFWKNKLCALLIESVIYEWGILLAERLGERDVKKVSMNQTSEGVARLGAKKHYHFLLMGTCL